VEAPRKVIPRFEYQDIDEKASADIDGDVNERNILNFKRRHAAIATYGPEPESSYGPEPETYKQAIASKDKEKSQGAIKAELESLEKTGRSESQCLYHQAVSKMLKTPWFGPNQLSPVKYQIRDGPALVLVCLN
jgi:hypothetical protein